VRAAESHLQQLQKWREILTTSFRNFQIVFARETQPIHNCRYSSRVVQPQHKVSNRSTSIKSPAEQVEHSYQHISTKFQYQLDTNSTQQHDGISTSTNHQDRVSLINQYSQGFQILRYRDISTGGKIRGNVPSWPRRCETFATALKWI
jgi:exonuclease VII large subunit